MNCSKIFFLLLTEFAFMVPATFADSFTDRRDSQVYKTVTIGGQTWMAENLNYKTRDSWCYDDDFDNCSQYGRLYTWNAAMGACPTGWRLPNNQDYKQLKKYAEQSFGSGKAGAALKSRRFGFNLITAGDKIAGSYKFLGETAYLWSADEEDGNRAYDWVAAEQSDDFVMGNIKYALKKNGFSVRCIQESSGYVSTPKSNSKGGFLYDSRDGRSYKTVKIGSQVWMGENLAFETRRSQCKDGKSSNCSKYGMYYTWWDALKVCPEGSHLPSAREWGVLWTYVNKDKTKLVSEKEFIVYTDCGYCGTGCAGACYDEETRRETYGRISENACMERCEAERKEVTRSRPSNSTGFSALLNVVSESPDAEGWSSETGFAYWNSSDAQNYGNEDEYDGWANCPGPKSSVLFSTDALGDDVEGCEEGTLEKIKSNYYPVRCILD